MILTHQHIDHLGLVSIVASRSGAEVAAIDVAVPYVENFSLEDEADDDFAGDIMLRHGIPEDVATALQSVSRAFRAWGSGGGKPASARRGGARAVRPHTAGLPPPHSPRDTILHDRGRRLLIAADHLLRTSRPTRSSPDLATARTSRQYLDSLWATRQMDVELVLPGHDGPITEHRRLIDQRFALRRRRADKIQRVLEERSRSAYEIAQALWGNIAVTQAHLTLSEVLGHLDLLTNVGRARQLRSERLSLFEAVPDPRS